MVNCIGSPGSEELKSQGFRFSSPDQWKDLAYKAEFRPSKLAELLGISLRTLQRHFARNPGMRVVQWMQSIRLDDAYERIVAGERVKVVAYDLGYKQLSHFSREFKNHHGISPSLVSRSEVTLWDEQSGNAWLSASAQSPVNRLNN